MIVVVAAGSAEVLEPELLTALSVRSALVPPALAAALDRQGIGRMDPDGEHVWIEPAVLRGSAESAPERAAALARMLDLAARRGWVDVAGRVRAHVESAPD